MDQDELEWDCPNGTKYPPTATNSNSQSYAPETVLPNRAWARRQTDGQTGWFQYTPS